MQKVKFLRETDFQPITSQAQTNQQFGCVSRRKIFSVMEGLKNVALSQEATAGCAPPKRGSCQKEKDMGSRK